MSSSLPQSSLRASVARALCAVLVLLAMGCAPGPRETPPPTSVTAAELVSIVKDGSAPATLVAAWANWCGPCRDEFPSLLWLRHTHGTRGLRVVLVSVDQEKERKLAQRFLELHDVDFETFIGPSASELAPALHGEWTGAIPATFLFDRNGRLHYFEAGKVGYTQLRSQVEGVLEAPRGPSDEGSGSTPG